MARPTKLTPEMLQLARDYRAEHDISVGTLLPTIEGLAMKMKVNRDTVYAWEKDDNEKEFSDIVKDIRQFQAQKLIQNSLIGRYNPMIAKLLLSKHGYIEESKQDLTSNGESITFTNGVPRPKG